MIFCEMVCFYNIGGQRLDFKGLIPRQRNSLREAVYAQYGWLHMNNSIEFSLREKKIRFGSE